VGYLRRQQERQVVTRTALVLPAPWRRGVMLKRSLANRFTSAKKDLEREGNYGNGNVIGRMTSVSLAVTTFLMVNRQKWVSGCQRGWAKQDKPHVGSGGGSGRIISLTGARQSWSTMRTRNLVAKGTGLSHFPAMNILAIFLSLISKCSSNTSPYLPAGYVCFLFK